jgi:hypothetical protein
MAGQYNKPVQYRRHSAHKSRAQGDPSSLGFNTSARRKTRPSAGPERSQLLQILTSLTERQFFSVSAYFSCCAYIGGCLVFWFLVGFLDAPMFLYATKFLEAPRFLDAPMFFYKFAGAYILVYFSAFLFSMRQ